MSDLDQIIARSGHVKRKADALMSEISVLRLRGVFKPGHPEWLAANKRFRSLMDEFAVLAAIIEHALPRFAHEAPEQAERLRADLKEAWAMIGGAR